MGVSYGAPNNGINADWGIPRGFAALHTPAGYAGRWASRGDGIYTS